MTASSILQRRGLVAGAAAMAAVCARPARADYPAGNVNFVIPDSPGGNFDLETRTVSRAMQAFLPGRPNLNPVNVTGAGGGRGTVQIYHARPDGSTIGVFSVPGVCVLQQRGNAGFDLAQCSWIGRMGHDHHGLVVAADSPIRTFDDLMALSRERVVKFTSSGPASSGYNATLIATKMLGIRAQVITGYAGSNEFVVAVVRGDGDAALTSLPILRRMAKAGLVRILATTEEHTEIPGAMDATTLGKPELAKLSTERLIGGPPKLPRDVVEMLSGALTRALADPEVIAWGHNADADLSGASPTEAAEIVAQQAAFIAEWTAKLG
jgi:tripartite-type tricarboxylate transporter receptor subunit TctC